VQDRYTASGRKGQQVYLDAKECAATGNLLWTLLGPDDEAVFEDEAVCSTTSAYDQTVTLPQDGSYQLTVKGDDDATGTYRVKIQSR